MTHIKVYDTTLRDGAQAEGVSYSVGDKVQIVKKLAELGVHFVEGGWPGSNPKDLTFFKTAGALKLGKTKLVAFGSTRRRHIKAHKDKNLQALLKAGTEYITVFGKSWVLQVKDILKVSLEENLKMVDESIRYLRKKGRKVFFDAEHFFDGYKDNAGYALKVLTAAQDAGAEGIILCDTNGGSLTSEISAIVKAVKKEIKINLGIHTHNDIGMAAANSVAAVEAGCTQVQGTINGCGERCGNADLCVIIPTLQLKLGLNCLSPKKLKELTEVSHYVSEVSNMKQSGNQPYVGLSAFAHKGGVHVNAVMKNPTSYEHIKPEEVGNKRRFLISEWAGRSSILMKAKELNIDLDKDTPQTKKILEQLQDMENEGYHFEAGEASFELLMKRMMKKSKKFFELEGFRVINEKRIDPKTKMPQLYSEATIKLKVNGIMEHTAAEGDGPINALDNALRKALEDFYPSLKKMHLADFKVRVLDQKAGTAAKVRVLIQSQDEEELWSTVGVSGNIIEASWQALVDSIEYKLLKDGKKL
ncbi:MAG: citramalate synthase [Candidatus Omnitrophica bacterium]|nr:citramalate synthase [Candidatus Omnitrophota bacterium]